MFRLAEEVGWHFVFRALEPGSTFFGDWFPEAKRCGAEDSLPADIHWAFKGVSEVHGDDSGCVESELGVFEAAFPEPGEPWHDALLVDGLVVRNVAVDVFGDRHVEHDGHSRERVGVHGAAEVTHDAEGLPGEAFVFVELFGAFDQLHGVFAVNQDGANDR